MKSKQEIMQSTSSTEVWGWIVEASKGPAPVDQDVIGHFDQLRKDELRAVVGPDFDPESHYDFKTVRKKEQDA